MTSVQIVKLSTGEDIIGALTEVTLPEGRMLEMEKPCIILLRPKDDNPKEFGLGLAPYSPYAKGFKLPIMPAHVVSVFEPDPTLLNEYNTRFGSGLIVPEKTLLKG